jgi:hypothetical protein
MKAHAVVFTAPNKVEYAEVNCPDPTSNDVVVRVTHSWISNGTEGSYLRGERIAGDTPYRAGDPWPFPIVSGYQKIRAIRLPQSGKPVEEPGASRGRRNRFAGAGDVRASHLQPDRQA